MKRKTTYYVTRKNVLTWLAAILALAAAVGYILNMTCGKGAGEGAAYLWLRCILPVAAALHFILTVLLYGKDRLYRIAVSYWMLTVSLLYTVFTLGCPWYLTLAMVLAQLVSAVGVTVVASGKTRMDWLLILFAAIPIAGILWSRSEAFYDKGCCAGTLLGFLPPAVFLLAYIVLSFAVHAYPDDGTYHPYWGDRPDGRRVRTLDPISVVASYIMPDRNGASNMFKGKLEISNLERYIREKKVSGSDGFSITVPLLAAYVRTVAKYPGLNRFLSGQKIYSRDEDIQFCMVIKKDMKTDGSETIIKLHLTPADTAMDVYEKFNAAVAEVHKSDELDSTFDGVAKIVGAIPGVLLKFAIWLLKTIDYFGLLPKFLLEVSPFHGSIFFTSMGSLGIPSIYHHLYDFGNLPAFCAFGRKSRVKELDDAGTPIDRKYIDYAFTLDERTVDGFYYATAFKYFERLLRHPEVLDERPSEINHDIP